MVEELWDGNGVRITRFKTRVAINTEKYSLIPYMNNCFYTITKAFPFSYHYYQFPFDLSLFADIEDKTIFPPKILFSSAEMVHSQLDRLAKLTSFI